MLLWFAIFFNMVYALLNVFVGVKNFRQQHSAAGNVIGGLLMIGAFATSGMVALILLGLGLAVIIVAALDHGMHQPAGPSWLHHIVRLVISVILWLVAYFIIFNY